MNAKAEETTAKLKIWRSALAMLKEQVPVPSFRTWLESAQLDEIKGEDLRSVAVVAVPSTFAAEWLRHHYRMLIAEVLGSCIGRPVTVSFAVYASPAHRAIRALDGVPFRSQSNSKDLHPKEAPVPVAVGQSAPLPTGTPQIPRRNSNVQPIGVSSVQSGARHDEGTGLTPVPALNPHYTFDRFIVGRANHLAASVAHRVAEEPGAAYNPLFIYGLRGAGKTHLLHAIGNDAYSRTGCRVLSASATLFDNYAVASRLLAPNAARHIDLLLIDDLHHIASGSGIAAQRGLASLVEGVLAAGKAVVVAGAQSLDSMLALHNNLHSRLKAGMTVAIELPDVEMRLRTVSHMAQRSSRPITLSALELIASKARSMAELASLWESVAVICDRAASREEADEGSEQPGPVTLQHVQAALAQSGATASMRPHTKPERIIGQVASYFDLETNEICSSSRERRVMFPRQVAMYLIREQCDSSYESIAHRFARRDHTTAMHSCARVEELSQTNLEVLQIVLELRQMIHGEHERLASLDRTS